MTLADQLDAWLASNLRNLRGASIDAIVFAYRCSPGANPIVDAEMLCASIARIHAITTGILASATKP